MHATELLNKLRTGDISLVDFHNFGRQENAGTVVLTPDDFDRMEIFLRSCTNMLIEETKEDRYVFLGYTRWIMLKADKRARVVDLRDSLS